MSAASRVMLRTLYGKTLWDQRRALAGWSLAFLLLPFLLASYWPALEEQSAQMEALLDSYPPALKALFSLDDLASPEGYLKAQLFSVTLPVLFLVFAIGRGADLVAGEEERGALDALLAHPLTRRRLVLEKAAALATAVAWLGSVAFAALAAGAAAFDLGVGPSRLAAAMLMLVLLTLGFAMVAFAAGAARGRKGPALALGGGVAAAAYLLNTLGALFEGLRGARWASPFAHYLETNPLRDGLDPGSVALLALIPIAAVAVAAWAFDRRDVGV